MSDCEHYDSQVSVQITELEITDEDKVEDYCAWCGNLPDVVVSKSNRHTLYLCDECRNVLDVTTLQIDGDTNG